MKSTAFKLAVTAAAAAGFVTLAPVATAADLQACRTNHYRVDVGSTEVWDDPGSRYVKTKYYWDVVTGPNSNLGPIDSGPWRKVYVSSGISDGIGWIRATHLRYRYCD